MRNIPALEEISESALGDNQIVFIVPANPKPDEIIAFLDRDCPIVAADSRRPKSAGLLKMDRAWRGSRLSNSKHLSASC